MAHQIVNTIADLALLDKTFFLSGTNFWPTWPKGFSKRAPEMAQLLVIANAAHVATIFGAHFFSW